MLVFIYASALRSEPDQQYKAAAEFGRIKASVKRVSNDGP
jgi:hypothetical protein